MKCPLPLVSQARSGRRHFDLGKWIEVAYKMTACAAVDCRARQVFISQRRTLSAPT
jgi:hypothetical protein